MTAHSTEESLPNSLPRPPDELAQLQRVWEPPHGIATLKAVNNTTIGLWYIGTALLFLILGGILALLMRLQLAAPMNDFIDHDLYNQLFTMHGSVMMFLFAVPVIEAVGVLLLPAMLGARDLPFPRLSAYAFWAYAIGGLAFFCTLFFDLAPDGGWFMYPPLTGHQYSPGLRTDFWLLGIGFIEISAIAGAIEIVVGILRTRPPGMTLMKMPVYVWAMLVVGLMIVFAFPPVILATALLELERAFDWPFFIADRGGQPLLWQHLFWLFGHPDVYIIFLPAAGLVSMMIPTLARTRLVGYSWVVWAMIGTGLVSFTLWIHHMFATGMSHMSTALSSAASMAVAIPTAVQVFAWLATLQQGRVQKSAPTWFILGFFGIFVLGGLSGVMIAVVPYDWQVHDTYFIVAHLHYVLIGGMVFPVFAAIYYWAPMVTGQPLSERMGKWGCALMFIGFTVTFLPMHWTGLLGMPRRVWTYVDGLGWDSLNLTSTVGSFVLATGFAIVFLDLLLHFRVAGKVDTNPWNAATLEWLPTDTYATRSIPRVSSREPLWDQPNLREQIDSGQHYLPGTVTGTRETIVTSPKDATPQYLMRLPGPSWWPLLAGAGTAAFFLLLTVKLMMAAAIGGAIALISIFIWLWEVDPPPTGKRYPIGDGIELPVYMTGPRSHSWWGVMVLNLVDATIFACLIFTYFYLWEGGWPPRGTGLPSVSTSTLAIVSWLAGGGLLWFANRSLRNRRPLLFAVSLVVVALLAWAALGAHYVSLQGANVTADANSYGAVLYTILAWHGLHAVVVTLAIGYTLARQWAGLITHEHRVVFDNTRLLWFCAAAEAIVGLLVIHTPRVFG